MAITLRLFERLFICGPQRRAGRTLHHAIRRARARAQLGGFNLGWQALSVAFFEVNNCASKSKKPVGFVSNQESRPYPHVTAPALRAT